MQDNHKLDAKLVQIIYQLDTKSVHNRHVLGPILLQNTHIFDAKLLQKNKISLDIHAKILYIKSNLNIDDSRKNIAQRG